MRRTLETVLDDAENGFNLVRLAAAVVVIASHSFMLVYGSLSARPLSWGPYEMGSNAVNIFFFLSGLMLSRSHDRKPGLLSFVVARFL